MRKGELVKKLEFGGEEAILFFIIILNILDAFEIIGSDLDYVKKIISWTALGMLIYKASLSKIFVGFRKPKIDLILIFAYFLMIIKNLISYADSAINGASEFLKPFYQNLISNAVQIEVTGLYLGLFLIVVACINLSLRTPLIAPSILHLMRADKVKHDTKTFILHFSSLLLISLAFFLIFFNLIMEWLAIAIDAPLLMIGLVSYFFIVIKHKDKFHPKSFLKKFGDFGSDFYEGIIKHLRYKRAFLRVVSAILILHILTDMLTFLWYYLFGIGDPLYLNLIGAHPSFVGLVMQDSVISWLSAIIHFGNLIALFILMVTPILLWFALYFHKKLKISNRLSVFLFFCLLIAILNPAFRILPFENGAIYGVDIIGTSVSTFQIIPLSVTLIVALLVTLLVSNIHSSSLKTILVIASKTFFIIYVVMYFFSLAKYYIHTIPLAWVSYPVVGGLFSVFFLITIVFYIVGLLSFLIDTQNHLKDTF